MPGSGLVRDVLTSLNRICGSGGLLTEAPALLAYQADALQHRCGTPAAVLLPSTPDEVVQIVRACYAAGVPFVARGHGTGLSGGATPVAGGIVIGLSRLGRIVAVDPANRIATVEAGVTNAAVTRAAAPFGLYFAPDPSSAEVCSIGGNIAENAGGAHCLKYGTTINHVLGIDVVLPEGTLIRLGGNAPGLPGSELIPLFVGSEGTLGIVTQATLRLTGRPEAVSLMLATFHSMVAAGEAVSRVIAAGIVPAAMEAMDRLAIEAGEPIAHAGLALVDAALLIELDGPEVEVNAHAEICAEICRAAGASDLRVARNEAERAALWKARKAAVAGMGRISPAYLLQDAVVPRSRLPEALSHIAEIAARNGLPIANVFHAGDGNLHPVICYDPNIRGNLERAREAAAEIMGVCLQLGGSLTGEHGIGLDKQASLGKMLGPAELETHGRIRRALDVTTLANPGKSIPAAATRPRPLRTLSSVDAWAEACAPEPNLELRPASDADDVAGLRPSFIAEPATPTAAARLLAEATARGVAIVIRGGATKLDVAAWPERCDAILDTRRLRGVIDHRPEDFVATVPAGTTIDEANAELARFGQWLAIDPPFHASATVGGVVAANDCGPRRLRNGTPRDRILAAHFVRPDGELITAGAAVLKNVVGYDLARLLAGTGGAFGVITDVSLRLSPLKPASVTLSLGFEELDHAAEFLAALHETALEPSAVNLAMPRLRILVRFESVAAACAAAAEQASKLARDCGATVEQLDCQTETHAWEEHERETWRARGIVALTRASPGTLVEMLRFSATAAWSPMDLAANGPIAAGELVISIGGNAGASAGALANIRSFLATRGGSVSVRRLPPGLDRTISARIESGGRQRVLQALKSGLDPEGILNPGILQAF